jgi:hypothetical protein
MLLAALIIGLVTAYFLGFRSGGVAAAVAAGLFLLAAIFPPLALPAYGLVAAGVAVLCVLGPRMQKDETRTRFREEMARVLSKLWKLRRRS